MTDSPTMYEYEVRLEKFLQLPVTSVAEVHLYRDAQFITAFDSVGVPEHFELPPVFYINLPHEPEALVDPYIRSRILMHEMATIVREVMTARPVIKNYKWRMENEGHVDRYPVEWSIDEAVDSNTILMNVDFNGQTSNVQVKAALVEMILEMQPALDVPWATFFYTPNHADSKTRYVERMLIDAIAATMGIEEVSEPPVEDEYMQHLTNAYYVQWKRMEAASVNYVDEDGTYGFLMAQRIVGDSSNSSEYVITRVARSIYDKVLELRPMLHFDWDYFKSDLNTISDTRELMIQYSLEQSLYLLERIRSGEVVRIVVTSTTMENRVRSFLESRGIQDHYYLVLGEE